MSDDLHDDVARCLVFTDSLGSGIIPHSIKVWISDNKICPDCGRPAVTSNPKNPTPFQSSARFGEGEFSVCYNAHSVKNGFYVNTCVAVTDPLGSGLIA